MTHRYEIDPRPAALGGGWRLRLLEDDIEMGGGVFPVQPDVSEQEAYAEASELGESWLLSFA